MYEKIEKWYRLKLWTAAMVLQAADKGLITADQAQAITAR